VGIAYGRGAELPRLAIIARSHDPPSSTPRRAMSDPDVRFIIFAAFSALCLAGGYLARKRGWATESFSKPMHFYTLVFCWSPVSMVAFWTLPLSKQVLILTGVQPVLMLAAWGVTVLLTRSVLRHLPRDQIGVLTLISALSNQGFTLGAYLCYVLFEPSHHALSYAMACVTAMQVFMVLIFYPIARHYGPGDAEPVGKLIARSFTDIRAAPLFMAGVGLLLNWQGIEVPQALYEYHLLEIMFFVGAVGSYAGIGLRLRLGDSRKHLRLHAATAFTRFLAVPLVALAMIALLHYTPWRLDELPRNVLIIEALTPSAIAAVIIPNLFHLDARLASVLWLWNTAIFCAVCLPVILLVF
jgi:predicted permease